MIRAYVLQRIGNLKLASVMPSHIQEILSEMAKGKLGPQTQLHVYNFMNMMFKDAVVFFDYLPRNPVAKVGRPQVPLKERPHLSPADAFKLLNHARSHYLAPAIWISLLAGLRTSELQALRWESVDFNKSQILIREAYKRGIGKIEPFPKQKDWGYAVMPEPLKEFLASRALNQLPSAFVCQAMRGGMLEQKKLHNGLEALCRDAGVKTISPHGMRHSCTEIWCSGGATVEDIRRLLNHRSLETTTRYMHGSDERLQRIAKDIELPIPKLKIVD